MCPLAESHGSLSLVFGLQSAQIRTAQSCDCPKLIGCDLIDPMEAGRFRHPQEPSGVPGVEPSMYSRVEKLVLTVPLVRGPLAAYTVTV